MDVLERLYEINNYNVHTKRRQRIEQLQKKAQIAKKSRGDLIKRIKLRRGLHAYQHEKNEHETSQEIETQELHTKKETEEPDDIEAETKDETEETEETEEPDYIEEPDDIEAETEDETEETEESEEETEETEGDDIQPEVDMDDIENKQSEEIEDTDSEDEFDIDEESDSVIILPSTMNWYTCGYEHIIKSLNAPIKVFDISTIEADIIRVINNVKNVYFLRRIPDIIRHNQDLPCLQDTRLILIPGTDGFAIYDLNISEIMCINPSIYNWADEIFESDTIQITKVYGRNLKVMTPKTFSQHQVLFLHIMDSFIAHTDIVLNAWLDKRIKQAEPYPQLLILAEFSQFYQIFQIFRKSLEPIPGQTHFFHFKDLFKVKNRNIYISFYNYSFEELEQISKSVAFMIQPGSSEVKKLARKWGCGLIAQNNDNGFELEPRFIDHNLIFKRDRLELYVNEGDQEYPHKYTTPVRLLSRVLQASQYMHYKRLSATINV